jgi:hypothetical protein
VDLANVCVWFSPTDIQLHTDIAFLLSNYFKRERLGDKRGASDILFSELGGRAVI